jgi:Rod binding domain-containing protein
MAIDPTFALSARAALQNAPVNAPLPTRDAAAAKKAAEEFEAIFVAQFLGSMFQGIKTDGPFGGGPGEEIFRSLMLDQYGRRIASQGGFGLADAVKRQLLSLQETAE